MNEKMLGFAPFSPTYKRQVWDGGENTMTTHFNKTCIKERRRALRKNMPTAERLLWSKLRGKALVGHKFRRQYSVENFVIDFYCPQAKLAIEVDGESHYRDAAEEYDRLRQEVIEKFGISFLRFTNAEVYENLDGVVEKIREWVDLPPPLLRKEGR